MKDKISNREKQETEKQQDWDQASPSETKNSAPQEEISQLEKEMSASQVAQLEEKIAQLEDLLLRSKADFINFRKRLEREKEEWALSANEGLLKDLLPILDNFSRGLEAAQNTFDGELLKGFGLIEQQFCQFFEKRQVKAFGQVGDLFDPHQADAMAITYDERIPNNHLAAIIRPGYRMGDRLLRPALVVVSKGPAPAAEPAKEEKPAPNKANEIDEKAGANKN